MEARRAETAARFDRFHGAGILAGQTEPARDLTILVALGALGVAIAYRQFERRDV